MSADLVKKVIECRVNLEELKQKCLANVGKFLRQGRFKKALECTKIYIECIRVENSLNSSVSF